MYTSITIAQNLQKALSTGIQELLLNHLGHKPEEINCQFYNNKLAIVIKNALTKPEQLLIAGGYEDLVLNVRNSIEEIIRPKLKSLIEEVIEIKVVDILFATHLDTNYVTVITLLESDRFGETLS